MSTHHEDPRHEADPDIHLSFAEEGLPTGARIKVVGVGGGGCSAVNRMVKARLNGIEFVAMNTDSQALGVALAPTRIQLGAKLTKGLGAGADPEVGRQAAVEDTEKIIEILDGADMVFITAGMGGGTGTGAAPIIASLAAELGALTVGVVTKPFRFEGRRRMESAEQGLLELREHVDTIITIPNERLLNTIDQGTSLVDAFSIADDVLRQAVQGISDLITIPGEINLDFADVRTVMKGRGMAVMGTGVAEGESRAVEAAQRAISSPLLEEASIDGAKGVLINITGDRGMTLFEVSEASRIVQEAAAEDAEIIFGTVVEENMGDAIKITVIATGFDRRRPHLHQESLSQAQQMPIQEQERITRQDLDPRMRQEPRSSLGPDRRMETELPMEEPPPYFRRRRDEYREDTGRSPGHPPDSGDPDMPDNYPAYVEVDKNNLDYPTFLRRKLD